MSWENAPPIARLHRKGFTEVLIYGSTWVLNGQSDVEGPAPSDIVTRSLFKPWQMMAAGGFSQDDCFALGVASHSGQSLHEKRWRELSERTGIDESALHCPAAYPMDSEEQWRRRLSNQPRARWAHPCSGKHALMAWACQRNDWPADYRPLDHPLQQRLQSEVARDLGHPCRWVTDSCGVPAAVVRVDDFCHLWQKFATSEDEASTNLKQLWLRNPKISGGQGRLDTLIMEAGQGKVLAKEGADGLLMVQTLGDQPTSCLVKVASGYDRTNLALVLTMTLRQRAKLSQPLAQVLDAVSVKLEGWLPADQTIEPLT